MLRAIAERWTLCVNMTVSTLRPGLARQLEPRAPRPDLRLRAVERLREAGITTGIHVMPVVRELLIARKIWMPWRARQNRPARNGWPWASSS